MNYEEALALMKKAKNPSKGKPIANNTRLYVGIDGSFRIKLHGSTIITIYPNHIVLDSCGYRTRTTKDRMNTFTPFYVSQKNYKWYVNLTPPYGEKEPFYDGMKLEVKE